MPWRKGQQLRLAAPENASPDVAEIYAEMQDAMGLPFVDKLHQAYGMCPEFLKEHWQVAGPVVKSRQFLECAELLAREAEKQVQALAIPDLQQELASAQVSEASRADIRACLELFRRESAGSLLLCAWQVRAFQGAVGSGAAQAATVEKDGHLPIIIRDDAMAKETKRTLEDIREKTGAPALDLYYLAMARWKDLLCDFWRRMRDEMESPKYEECRKAIRDHAWNLCDELPGPAELTAAGLLGKIDEGVVASLVRITDAFNESLSALVLNVAWTRSGLGGGNASGRAEPPVIQSKRGEKESPNAA